MAQRLNLRSKLTDNELDLSLMQLTEVPVKDIAAIPKATSLDLSNNQITSLGLNFPSSLTHLVKLDLSRNQLKDLPENFGQLRALQSIDLSSNQIFCLPLSFSSLNRLRWLDLSDNPLLPALSDAAGTCTTKEECVKCAKGAVSFMTKLQSTLEHEKERRRKETQDSYQSIVDSVEADIIQLGVKKAGRKKNKRGNKGNKNSEPPSPPVMAGSWDASTDDDPCWNEPPLVKKKAYVTGSSKKRKGNKNANGEGSSTFRCVSKWILLGVVLSLTIHIFQPQFYHLAVDQAVGLCVSITNTLPTPIKATLTTGWGYAEKWIMMAVHMFAQMMSVWQMMLSKWWTKLSSTGGYKTISVAILEFIRLGSVLTINAGDAIRSNVPIYFNLVKSKLGF